MRLTLILPGLPEVFAAEQRVPSTRLAKWLSRARLQRCSVECYEQALLFALEQAIPSRADIPGAQCTFIPDFNESAPSWCCRADPVQLQLDTAERRLERAMADLGAAREKAVELERERELQNKSLQVLHQQLELERSRRAAGG